MLCVCVSGMRELVVMEWQEFVTYLGNKHLSDVCGEGGVDKMEKEGEERESERESESERERPVAVG